MGYCWWWCGAREEGILPTKHRPLKVTCTHKLVSTSLRSHCILKYYKQEKKINLGFLSCLLLGGSWYGPSPQHKPCCGWTPATLLSAEPSRGSLRAPAALRKRSHESEVFLNICLILSGREGSGSTFASQRPWPYHCGCALGFYRISRVAILSFRARCSNTWDCAKSPFLLVLEVTGENVPCVSNRSDRQAGKAHFSNETNKVVLNFSC